MFNVGGPEILVILLVALVVLGPEQLPKAMRTFGNVMGEIRKVSSGFQSEMRNAMNAVDATVTGGNTASTPAAADVTETIARNDDPAPPAGRDHDAGTDHSSISPADRAAG